MVLILCTKSGHFFPLFMYLNICTFPRKLCGTMHRQDSLCIYGGHIDLVSCQESDQITSLICHSGADTVIFFRGKGEGMDIRQFIRIS